MKDTIDQQPSRDSELRLTRRGKLARAALIVGGSLLVVGGANEVADYDTVGSETTIVDQGGTAYEAVREAVDTIADEQNIDPTEITGSVGASQEVSRELSEVHDGPVQPGDTIEVTVEKNGLGWYKVSADPHDEN